MRLPLASSLLSIGLVACGGSDPGLGSEAPPPDAGELGAWSEPVARRVGAEGGAVDFPGGRLLVAPGALEAPVRITATSAPGGVRLEPSGLRFLRPATLTLRAPEPGQIVKIHDAVHVEGMDAPARFVEPLATRFDGAHLVAEIRGFSTYVREGGRQDGARAVVEGVPGRLIASWDPCRGRIELRWTGTVAALIERVELRGAPRTRSVRRFLMAASGPEPWWESAHPAASESELAPVVRFEAYRAGQPEWARVRFASEARVVLTPPGSGACGGAGEPAGCARVGPPRIRALQAGEPLERYEAWLRVPQDVEVELSMDAEVLGDARYTWALRARRGSWRELGEGARLRSGLDCGETFCELRAAVTDPCGTRATTALLMLDP